MPSKVLQLGNPILRKISKPVSKGQPINEIIDRLVNVLKGIKKISSAYGNGLAAPQVGFNYRIITLYFDNEYHIFINPRIVKRSREIRKFYEGCLSFFYLRGLVKRPRKIMIAAYNSRWEKIVHEFNDELASLVLHEMDHLNGILFIDRIKEFVSIDEKYDSKKLEDIKKIIDYVTSR